MKEEIKVSLRVTRINESDMEEGKVEISGDSADGRTMEFLVSEEESCKFYFGQELEVSISFRGPEKEWK